LIVLIPIWLFHSNQEGLEVLSKVCNEIPTFQ